MPNDSISFGYNMASNYTLGFKSFGQQDCKGSFLAKPDK